MPDAIVGAITGITLAPHRRIYIRHNPTFYCLMPSPLYPAILYRRHDGEPDEIAFCTGTNAVLGPDEENKLTNLYRLKKCAASHQRTSHCGLVGYKL